MGECAKRRYLLDCDPLRPIFNARRQVGGATLCEKGTTALTSVPLLDRVRQHSVGYQRPRRDGFAVFELSIIDIMHVTVRQKSRVSQSGRVSAREDRAEVQLEKQL